MENQENDSTTNSSGYIPYEKFVPLFKNTILRSRDEVINFLAPQSEGNAFGFLTDALQDPEILVRSKALEAIEYVYTSKYLHPVITARSDEDSHIRERANRILTNHASNEISYEDFVSAVNFFSTKTYFEKKNIRNFLNSLDNMAFELISEALKDPAVNVRSNVLWGLYYIYTPQYRDLVVAIMRDENSGLRQRAISFFGQRKYENDNLNDDVVEPLIKALDDENRDVRYGAIHALGNIKDARAAEPLLKFLQDEDGYVIRSTARVLGEIGDKRAVQPLLEVLERRPIFLDLEDGTRTGDVADGEIAYALAAFKDPRAYIPITKLLTEANSLTDKDEVAWVRSYAIMALGRQGDERAVDLLVAVLENKGEDEDIRESAAEALGNIGSKLAVEPLIRALEDESFHVRESAAIALSLLKDKRALEPLLRALERNDFVSVPSNYSVMVSPGLHKAVESNEHTRGTAAYALGLLGDKSVTQTLINLLTNESVWVRERAVAGLGQLGDKQALEALKAIKTDNIFVQETITESIEQLENQKEPSNLMRWGVRF